MASPNGRGGWEYHFRHILMMSQSSNDVKQLVLDTFTKIDFSGHLDVFKNKRHILGDPNDIIIKTTKLVIENKSDVEFSAQLMLYLPFLTLEYGKNKIDINARYTCDDPSIEVSRSIVVASVLLGNPDLIVSLRNLRPSWFDTDHLRRALQSILNKEDLTDMLYNQEGLPVIADNIRDAIYLSNKFGIRLEFTQHAGKGVPYTFLLMLSLDWKNLYTIAYVEEWRWDELFARFNLSFDNIKKGLVVMKDMNMRVTNPLFVKYCEMKISENELLALKRQLDEQVAQPIVNMIKRARVDKNEQLLTSIFEALPESYCGQNSIGFLKEEINKGEDPKTHGLSVSAKGFIEWLMKTAPAGTSGS